MWSSVLALISVAAAAGPYTLQTSTGKVVKESSARVLNVNDGETWTFELGDGGFIYGQAQSQGLLGTGGSDGTILTTSATFQFTGALFRSKSSVLYQNSKDSFVLCPDGSIAYAGDKTPSCGGSSIQLYVYGPDGSKVGGDFGDTPI